MPRVPLQSLVSARHSGTAVQPGVFQQTASATADLLSSVNGAAQAVKQQFDQAQEFRNRSDISERKREIREAQAIFQNELTADNVDPSEWGPRWQQRLKELQGTLGLNDSKVPPAVKREVGQAFEQFAGSSFIQISGAALKENQRRARQNFDRDYQFNAQNGDHDANDLLVEQNRDLLGDDYADDTLRTNRLMKKKDEIELSRDIDPIGHLERVKAGDFGLSKVHQQREIKAAETLVKRREAEALADLRESEQAGLIENEDELIEILENDPYISEKSKKARLRNYRKTAPLSDRERQELQDKADALVGLRDKPDEYEAAYYDLVQEFESVGQRSNKPAVNLYNVRPELFSQERLDALSDKQRSETLRPIGVTFRKLVKERARGLASISFTEQKSAEDLVGNASLKNRLDEHAILLESAINRAGEEFLTSFPAGEKPSEADLRKFLNENADKINLEVLRKPSEKIEPRTSSADKAHQWLGSSGRAGNTLLPKLGTFNPNSTRGEATRGGTIKAQVTRYGYVGDKYQRHDATVNGSKHENLGNRANILERNVSVALPPATAKKLGVSLKSGDFVEAKIGECGNGLGLMILPQTTRMTVLISMTLTETVLPLMVHK